jgi:glycosyltransferase involved in cell wall biosynthesis
LFEFDINAPAWVRYPSSAWKTIAVLLKENPGVIFAQNPSLILAMLVIAYGKLFHKKVIIDAHNAGLFPVEGKYKVLNWVATSLFRWATITIVSNDELKKYVESRSGHAISIPDPIPDIPALARSKQLQGEFNVLFVCSWAADEPFLEVLRAASLLDSSYRIYLTGNSKGKEQMLDMPVPGNAVLTGYLAENHFNEMLFSCDAVMVLTYRENCLLCGAYEGVAAGKPLVVTGTAALRNYFSSGAVYVDNSAASIAESIRMVRSRQDEFEREVRKLGELRRDEFRKVIKEFNLQLENLC